MKCPICKEEIQDEATVCHYCGKVLVEDPKEGILTAAIAQFQDNGYTLVNRTDFRAQLTRRKKFDWAVFVVLCVLSITAIGGILLLVFLLHYFTTRDETATLIVDETGNIEVKGVKPITPQKQLTNEERKQAEMKNLKIAGLLIGAIILLVIICSVAGGGHNMPIPPM